MAARRASRRTGPSAKRSTAARGRAAGTRSTTSGSTTRKSTSRRTTGTRRSGAAQRTTSKRTTSKRGAAKTTRSTTRRSSGSTSRKRDDRPVQDVMTSDPICLIATQTLVDAAEAMRDRDVGDVMVLDDTNGTLRGIVTDRDIVIRAVADGRHPAETTLGTVCTGRLVTIGPDEAIRDAARIMADNAIRRLPVVDGDRPIGIVSLGDLAVQRDRRSVLAAISSAPPDE